MKRMANKKEPTVAKCFVLKEMSDRLDCVILPIELSLESMRRRKKRRTSVALIILLAGGLPAVVLSHFHMAIVSPLYVTNIPFNLFVYK